MYLLNEHIICKDTVLFDLLFWFIIIQALWNAFFRLLHGPKEMVAPGPHDHFLSFCCRRCVQNHIKHLVRKSDVRSRYNFVHFTFRPLWCGTFPALKPKLCPFLNFSMMHKSPFLRLSILIIRLIWVLSVATETGE